MKSNKPPLCGLPYDVTFNPPLQKTRNNENIHWKKIGKTEICEIANKLAKSLGMGGQTNYLCAYRDL